MTRDARDTFNQPPPLEDFNRFAGNRPLRDALERMGASWAHGELWQAGEELGGAQWIARGELANRHPPRLHIYDRAGQRRDEFEFHPAWHQCLEWIKVHGLAGASWGDARPGAQVRRSALFQLFAEVECGSLCPATMTHGAIPVLARGGDGYFQPWLDLLARPVYDPSFVPALGKEGLLMGMGLTEKQGGSDVRANRTKAEDAGDGWHRLHGHKWFLSAVMCDAFLVTAREGDDISCFFLPRFTPDGERNGLRILREKDKLGDRSNASAEVEFHGALARRVGERGRGMATVLEMANHTRLDCANGSVGIMRAALAEALHWARHRVAFGKRLIDQPLMAAVLADLALELEGHIPLCLWVARAIERREEDEQAALLARLLIPVTKYWVCKRAPAFIAEAMEVIGGNGFVEDSPLPRLFRQSPLNSIWEGAGNVMCLDVLRVLTRERHAGDALLHWLEKVVGQVPLYDRALECLKDSLTEPDHNAAEAREMTGEIARLAQARLLIEDNGLSSVAEAFCAIHLRQAGIRVFGSRSHSLEPRQLLNRAVPFDPREYTYSFGDRTHNRRPW